MAKLWTEAEDDYLRRNFAQHGYKACSKKLPGRTPGAVRCRAVRLGLQFGDIKGYTSLPELAEESGLHLERLWIAAKRAGALYYPSKTQKKALVKNTWAEEYIPKKLEQDRNEKEGGLAAVEVAERLGVTLGSLQKALMYKSGYLAPFIGKMTVRQGRHGRFLFYEDEVEWIRLELAEYKAQLKGLKTAKAYWLENDPDVPYSTAMSRMKARHKTFRAVKGGTWQRFVDEAA